MSTGLSSRFHLKPVWAVWLWSLSSLSKGVGGGGQWALRDRSHTSETPQHTQLARFPQKNPATPGLATTPVLALGPLWCNPPNNTEHSSQSQNQKPDQLQAHLVQVKTFFSKHKKKTKTKHAYILLTRKKNNLMNAASQDKAHCVYSHFLHIVTMFQRTDTHTRERKPAVTLPDWIVISLCTMLKGSFTHPAKSTVKCAWNQTQEWSTSRKKWH